MDVVSVECGIDAKVGYGSVVFLLHLLWGTVVARSEDSSHSAIVVECGISFAA